MIGPLLVIAEPTMSSVRRALETAASGATLLVCGPTAATGVHILTPEAIREALKPSPVDHWGDALLEAAALGPDLSSPRTDRQARRGSSGRIERRGYGGRPW